MKKIVIGGELGSSYTVNDGTRTFSITIPGVSDIQQEDIAYVFNITQNKLYYAPAEDVALIDSVVANLVTIDSSFGTLVAGDLLHIQVWVRDYNISIEPTTHRSPNDFSASRTSSTTITLSDLQFTIANAIQIRYIVVQPSSGASFILKNGVNGVYFGYSSGVITVYGAGTPLASGDTYYIGVNDQDKAFDPSTQSMKISHVTRVPMLHTDPEPLASAQAFTTGQVILGTEIDLKGVNKLGIYLFLDVGGALTANADLYIYGRRASGGNNYTIDGISAKSMFTTASATDLFKYYEIDTGTLQYLAFYIVAGTAGTGTITAYIDKK